MAKVIISLTMSLDGFITGPNDDFDHPLGTAAYPGPTWDRLAAIKRRYDPTNLFRLNQNIPPAADASQP